MYIKRRISMMLALILSAIVITSCSGKNDISVSPIESIESSDLSSDSETSENNISSTESASTSASATASTTTSTFASSTKSTETNSTITPEPAATSETNKTESTTVSTVKSENTTETKPQTTTTTTKATTASTPNKTTTENAPANAAFIPQNATNKSAVTLSSGSGIYSKAFKLTLTSKESGTIYYTDDGSDPSISSTAKKYTSAITISDRSKDKNVVTAVDPVLFSGNYNKVNKAKNGFDCEYSAPSDSAVDKCTVIRAAVKKSDGTFTGETSATYFIGTAESHISGLSKSCQASGGSLAVISIQMNYDDLFDSTTGIYVKGDIFNNALKKYLSENRLKDSETARSLDANYKQRGREWERYASITMFEFSSNGAQEVLNQNCGIRIQGNYSRSDMQKGFRLFARADYGTKNFKYEVFGESCKNDSGQVMNKFKTLTLRAGGNCAFSAKFNDTFWQTLASGLNVETKSSRPCVVYINGEYWGLYILEEDYSDDYFEETHGVSKDDVVVYKGDAEALSLGYKLDEGELPAGVTNESYYFNDLLDFFKKHKNLQKQSDYDQFIKIVDPDSVMDYFAIECWINNKWDWPGKNWSMWKTIKTDQNNPYADGRWRFMVYDVEFGGVSGASDASVNTIKEDNYKPNGLLDTSTDNPAVLCFAYLMTNEGFRNSFYDRLNYLTDNNFQKDSSLKALDKFKNIYSPLYDQFFKRFPGISTADEAINGGYSSIKCIREFLEKRSNYIDKMINYCEKTLG